MIIMAVGPGRSGKDTFCDFFEKTFVCKNVGTCSKYLAKYVAEDMGLTEETAYANRHASDEIRCIWKAKGDEVRKDDPGKIIKEMIDAGEDSLNIVCGGPRDLVEIEACRKEKLVDLIVWIKRDVKIDPTLKFDECHTDITVLNNGTLEEFYEKLMNLGLALGFYLR